jgi:glycosyltransferase involved in cell wall biosynthesis
VEVGFKGDDSAGLFDSHDRRKHPLHIAILTQYYPPEIGAPQRRLSHLAERFVRAGHSVTVLTGMPNYPKGRIFPGYRGFLRREQIRGVNVIRAWMYTTHSARLLPRLMSYFSFVLSSAILGTLFLPRPDYLFVESPPLFLGLSGYWLSRLKSARLIFNVADLWPESAVEVGIVSRDSLAFRVSERLEKFCYKKSWLVTGQSKTILEDIRLRFPGICCFHLSNGVDTNQFQPGNEGNERATLGVNGDFLAMYAGLHGLAQGLEQVLDAAGMLNEDGFQFVFVGDGPRKSALQKQVRNRQLRNIRFLDARPAEELPSLLASADVLLVPLKGFIRGAVPSKLYEAMGSGRPVVLIAAGEAADVVRETNAGIVVRPGDAFGIANALRRLRTETQLAKTLGDNGRRAAVESFDRDRIATGFIDYLEANLARQAGLVDTNSTSRTEAALQSQPGQPL